MLIRVTFAATAASLGFATPAAADERKWDKASDISQGLVVAAAFGVPLVHGDLEGIGSAALSQVTTKFVTRQLKEAVGAERPDGSDNLSFPSGHTSASFAAAATLHKRYGWKYGVPAYAVASFTGAARVQARKHYMRDVIAGAALGTAGGWFLTRRRNDQVQWLPWGDGKSGGVQVSYRF